MKRGGFVPNLLVIIWTMALGIMAGCSGGGSNTGATVVPRLDVEIVNTAGTHYTVQSELARTPSQWQTGLMNRPSMGADEGMLFIFNDVDYRSFWMKNTMITLDMMFIGADLKIVDINENATPYSTVPFMSQGKAKYVLEVNGGYCAVHGVHIGDSIILPAGL